MEQMFYLMLYLAFAQLKGLELKNIQLHMTVEELVQLNKVSGFHSLTALVYDALVQIPTMTENAECQKVLPRFREAKEKSVRKNLLMDTERGKLFSYMKQKGIWYMPLKGVILKDLYPKVEERQMADNDIFFDKEYQSEVRDYFVSQGYEVVVYGSSNHDVYEKEPVYNFEMHTALYGEMHKDGWEQYYKDVRKRLITEDGLAYRFTNEDFYIYFMSHAYKHYDGTGTGIRFLLDLTVLIDKYADDMDWNYVSEELQKLGMQEFEGKSRELVHTLDFAVNQVFKDNKHNQDVFRKCLDSLLDEEQAKMLDYIRHSGSYGTMKNRVDRSVKVYEDKKFPRLHYYLHRLFPKYEFMRKYYGWIGRYKILLPVAWLYRIIRGLCWHPKKLLKEVKLVQQSK